MAQAQRSGIEIENITKRFGSVTANDQVCLAVKRGEILALLGENGSGKTTLMNMLSGIYYPDSGQIYVDGREVAIRSPKDAFAEGIGMIHQHFKLVDVLSAAENIVLGIEGAGRLNRKKLGQEIRGIGERYGFHIDPDKKIYRMSVSEKQTVEILKVLYRGADILILDEPTAVLTPQETDRLFDILRAMRDDGKAIIIITHKLNEVLAVSDRVSVLRRGQSIGTIETHNADAKTLTAMMVGHEVKMEILRLPPKEQTLCAVNDLTVRHSDGYLALDGVSFELKQGEILGVAGVAGSGQKELCEALGGLLDTERGSITMNGVSITGLSPSAQQKAGVRIGFIPEDRLGMGLVASLNIAENLLVRGYRKQKGMVLRRKPAIKQAEQMIDFLEINTKGPMQRVSELSGGNVQKVLLWRELTESPPMILTAYATRGLDISSSYMVYDMLTGQKAKGAGVLFVGEDLDVLLELCDRILVLCGGRVSGVVDARTATKEQIGLMMTDTGRAQA